MKLIILGIILIVSIILFIKLKPKNLKFVFGTLGCICIILGSIMFVKPLFKSLNYGLDLQGGFEVLYQVESLDGSDVTSEMVYSTYQAILKRIDILGVSEPEITIEGDDHIRVKLAGVTNKEEARNVISSTAALTFRDASDNLLMTADVLGGTAKVSSDQYGKPAVSLNIKDTSTFYDVTSKVKNMTNNIIVIWLDFDEATDSFAKEKNNCGSLSASKCLSAATVNEAFASNVIIQGNFTMEEAQSLVDLINSGALPTKLDEISSRTVAATYGANSLDKTLFAGIIGICLVTLLMIIVYHFSGFIASLCIVLYTVLTFGIFYLIDGVLTLPGIAAMLLGIGMAVDASVISYERIKEHLRIGKSLNKAFEIGNKSSFTSIIDANLTTMVVAIILFIFGQSSVKGFATMLIINILVTIFTMVFLEKVILRLFVRTGYFDNKLNFFINFNKKKIHKQEHVIIPFQKLEFVKSRKFFLTFTAIIIVVGTILSFTRGLNLGVDFTGGTSIAITETDIATEKSISKDLSDKNYTIKNTDSTNGTVTIVIDEVLDKDSISDLTSFFNTKYETESDIFVVSDVVKKELTKNAIVALILASIGIALYVSFRFKFNYAIGGLVALLHDVVMVTLFFSIFRIEITSIFIAAILTIIGYSINDTIVTFDMIRQLYKEDYGNNIKKESDLDDLVNDSVRLTLFRSILTTATTILPIICLILFGSQEIFNFNIALLVGFIVGVYSSIFISNQLWLYLEKRRIRKPKKVRKIDEIEEIKIKGINC